MSALFGWQDQPTPVEFFAFPIYWLVVTPVLCIQITRWKTSVEKKIASWKEEDNTVETVEEKNDLPETNLTSSAGEDRAVVPVKENNDAPETNIASCTEGDSAVGPENEKDEANV